MASTVSRTHTPKVGTPLAVSLALHGALVLSAIWVMRGDQIALPPVYKVDLVAAPAGPRSVGQVQTPTAPQPKADAPVPKSAETRPAESVPVKAPPPRRPPPAPTTQVPNAASAKPNAPAPKAGGGPTGGKGTDVANLTTGGIDFPFPTYLQNIANQIILNFDPSDRRPLTAEVYFQIQRNGSVTGFELRRKSGSYLFDNEARGAVEAAGRSRAFGPLPDGFKDDVLPVIFTFSPQMVR
ncbi:MAG: TonB C-terminal domain-containing protein [Gemmatimonadaceae bacterium]